MQKTFTVNGILFQRRKDDRPGYWAMYAGQIIDLRRVIGRGAAGRWLAKVRKMQIESSRPTKGAAVRAVVDRLEPYERRRTWGSRALPTRNSRGRFTRG